MQRKTNVNKRRLSISLISFILLILTITLVKEKIEDITKFREKRLSNIGYVNVKWNEDISMKGYGESVIIVDDKEITSYDFNNQKNWRRNIDNKQEIIYLGEDGIYIGNKDKGNIDKLDIDGKRLWKYDTKQSIYTLAENQGHLFIYSKLNEDERRITILDQHGKEVLSNDKSKEEILSANISPDKKRYIVTNIDKKSSELKSRLTYLDDKGTIIWGTDLDDKLIYNILFLDNKKMILVEDKQVICIDDKGEIIWSKDISNSLKDIKTLGDEKVYILYGTSNSYLEVLDSHGKIEYKKTFNKLYNKIITDQDNIILAGDTEILGMKEEKINLKYKIDGEAKLIDKFNNNIFVFKNDKIDIFDIVTQ